jgi:hypothetical protein
MVVNVPRPSLSTLCGSQWCGQVLHIVAMSSSLASTAVFHFLECEFMFANLSLCSPFRASALLAAVGRLFRVTVQNLVHHPEVSSLSR